MKLPFQCAGARVTLWFFFTSSLQSLGVLIFFVIGDCKVGADFEVLSV